jgi:hypothetical protein
MSTQAEVAFKILIRLYIELDQRTGWTTENQVAKVMSAKEGISDGRARDGLAMLKQLKMLELRRGDEGEQLKISSYGVEWLDKTCPLTSREPEYEFALPTFRSVKLVGPDEFYGRKRRSAKQSTDSIDWAKWGAIGALIAVPIPFIIWWLK